MRSPADRHPGLPRNAAAEIERRMAEEPRPEPKMNTEARTMSMDEDDDR